MIKGLAFIRSSGEGADYLFNLGTRTFTPVAKITEETLKDIVTPDINGWMQPEIVPVPQGVWVWDVKRAFTGYLLEPTRDIYFSQWVAPDSDYNFQYVGKHEHGTWWTDSNTAADSDGGLLVNGDNATIRFPAPPQTGASTYSDYIWTSGSFAEALGDGVIRRVTGGVAS